MRIRSLWLISAVLVGAACAPPEGRTNSDADTAAIRQLYTDWPRTIEVSDVAQYLTFLDDSITLLMPGAVAVHGIAAYRSALTPLFQAARYRVALAPPTLLEVAGPWAFAQYEGEASTLSAAGADSIIVRNRYVDILRRQPDGTWRVRLHSWHNGAPPAR